MVSEQSILEMKEISRSMSVGINEILRELRKVQSEMSSMTDNLSLLKEELRIMKDEEMEDSEEDESYGDEDEDDKELGEELTREATSGNLFNNNEDSKFIAKSVPIPSPDPYSGSIPNPETTLNSSSDQNPDLNLNLNLKPQLILSEKLMPSEDLILNSKSQLNPDVYPNPNRNSDSKFNPISDPNFVFGKVMDVEIIGEKIEISNRTPMAPFYGYCDEGSKSDSYGISLHANPDLDPDPPDTYHKQFNMCSSISSTLHTNSIPSKLVSDYVVIDDERNQLDKMKKREKEMKAKVAIDFEWNFLLNCQGEVRKYDEKSLVIVVEVVHIPYSFCDNNDENGDRKAFGKEEDVVRSKLLFLAVPQQESSQGIFIIRSASVKIQVAMIEVGMKLKSIIGLCLTKKWVDNKKGEKKEPLSCKCQYCAWFYEQAGDYVEIVHGEQVSLLSIVGSSTSERIVLGGVVRIMLSDSGIHVDEVENTCHKCLEKIQPALNFIVETENSFWFLVIGEYGCKSNMECIMKAIVLSVYISDRSVMERTPKHLVMQKPSKRVDVDKMDRLVKDLVLFLFGTAMLIDGMSFEDHSTCVGRTPTYKEESGQGEGRKVVVFVIKGGTCGMIEMVYKLALAGIVGILPSNFLTSLATRSCCFGDSHQEAPLLPQPPPRVKAFEIKSLNRLFHFFPP